MKTTVDTGEMKKAADILKQQSEEYSSIYTQLLNAANTMGSAWKAPDNLAYVDQINGFLEELKAMANHINQASQTLEHQALNYEATVDDNIVAVKNLAN